MDREHGTTCARLGQNERSNMYRDGPYRGTMSLVAPHAGTPPATFDNRRAPSERGPSASGSSGGASEGGQKAPIPLDSPSWRADPRITQVVSPRTRTPEQSGAVHESSRAE